LTIPGRRHSAEHEGALPQSETLLSFPTSTARQRLLRWYKHHGRHDMPWRKTRDPYRVWVSEIMLQQTTVATTLPFYLRFLKRFPTLKHLARAKLEQVLSVWSGLGYYARARNLHRAVKMVLKECGGKVPDGLLELRRLPGIGRYTAGAIRSLAFGLPAPILDGNVTRVLSRVLGIREDVRLSKNQEQLWKHAEAMADSLQARDVNLALFDLGATVCRPNDPLCGVCPLRGLCQAQALCIQEQIPFKTAPVRRQAVTWLVPLFHKDEKLLLALRKQTGLFAGLWEFPSIETASRISQIETLQDTFKRWGLLVAVDKALPSVLHSLTHRDFTMKPFLCRWITGQPEIEQTGLYNRFKWVAPEDIDSMAVSNLTRKILKATNNAEALA